MFAQSGKIVTFQTVKTLIYGTITIALFISLSLASTLHAVEASAPGKDRWNPVQSQLDAGDDNAALTLLNGIVSEFPNWPHGWLKRAEVHERLDNMTAAIGDAQKAYDLDAKSEEVVSTYARILVRQEQYQETIDVLKAYMPQADRKGWIHYYAAEAAFRLGDLNQATEYINLGLKNLDASVPPEFRFLNGRIKQQKGDLSGAAASFRRGLTEEASMASEWFNLGVIYRQLASQGEEQAKREATECFATAAQLAPNDAFSWFALGQSHIDSGNYVAAESTLQRSLTVFRSNNVSQGSELALTHASYGLALLKLGEEQNAAGSYADALKQFKLAEGLGLADAPLYNNMLAAAIGAQRQAKTADERAPFITAAEMIIQGPGGKYVSPVNLGINYFYAGQDQLKEQSLTAYRSANSAVDMLTRSLEGSSEQASIHRFIGHSHGIAIKAADALYANQMAAGKQDEAMEWLAKKEEHLDAGSAAYIQAGNLNDGIAQRFYLAQESERSPKHAYDAGWRFLGWRSYIQPAGWMTVIANYGGAEAYRSPLSIAIWSIILLIALILGLKGFLFPQKIEIVERESRSSTSRREAEPEEKATGSTRRAAPDARRKPSGAAPQRPNTARTARSPRPPQRDNRTTQSLPPQDTPAPTRRAVDDIARRMASQGNQSDAERPAQRTKARRSNQRRRPS